MKKKNFVKKLVLNKKTVSNLDGSAMNGIYGHGPETYVKTDCWTECITNCDVCTRTRCSVCCP
jgi:hypothetical protein